MTEPLILPQRLVVYDAPQERAKVFDSAYTDPQVDRALMLCKAKYGRRAKCRVMTAKERYPG